MKIPGIVIAASASGSGKTAVTMAMMKAFKNAGKKVRACHQKLQNQLLLFVEAQIALLDYLDIVVDKADTAKTYCHEEAAQQLCLHVHILGVLPRSPVEQYKAGRSGHKNADDEHKTAHRRRSVFLLMPLGAHFPDRLSEIDLVQKWYQPFPKQPRHCKRNDRRRQYPDAVRHMQYPLCHHFRAHAVLL